MAVIFSPSALAATCAVDYEKIANDVLLIGSRIGSGVVTCESNQVRSTELSLGLNRFNVRPSVPIVRERGTLILSGANLSAGSMISALDCVLPMQPLQGSPVYHEGREFECAKFSNLTLNFL